MARKRKFIAEPDAPVPTQFSLFLNPTINEKPRFQPYPRISRNPADIPKALSGPGNVYLDLEFNSKRPTILGVANDDLAVSIPWDNYKAKQVVETCKAQGKKLVAFSTVGADKKELDKALGVKTPLDMWEDGMLSMFLDNAELTKDPGKTEGDDASETGSLGYMNLGVGAVLYTDVPMYKEHRGNSCHGPCPRCDVWGYNSIDAWVGGQIFKASTKSMEKKGIPFQLYREMLELSELLDEMQTTGVLIDRKYVRELDKHLGDKKDSYFPHRLIHTSNCALNHGYGRCSCKTKKEVYDSPFNPKSPKAVKEWFWANGIQLQDADKIAVEAELERQCRRLKIPLGAKSEKWDSVHAAFEANELDKAIAELYKLHLYKGVGKGVGAWFDDSYFDLFDCVHPRFNPTGACTGRLSSSSPNLMNVPKRGEFGRLIRKAVKARPGMKFLRADYSQLELRIVLYLCGLDPSAAGKDAFQFLVSQANGQFDEAAARYGIKARDIAKVTSHSSNYGEGLVVLTGTDLSSARIKREISEGALNVCWDWEIGNGVVAFNGANLAERLFGDKSSANRKKALEVQEIYFKNFSHIRAWQKKVSQEIDTSGFVQSLVGRYLPLRQDAADNTKKGCAFNGQGVGADHAQAIMLKYKRMREPGASLLLQVHDELIFEVPQEWSNAKCSEFINVMTEETWRLPGFTCPIVPSQGPNWGDCKEFVV